MTGGIGFAGKGNSDLRSNRSLLKSKAPFQGMQENKFVNPPKKRLKMSKKLISKLIQLKENKKNNGLLVSSILTLFVIGILSLFIWSFVFDASF